MVDLPAVHFDIASSGCLVRPALPADAKALRMLLPVMSGVWGAGFVAVDQRHHLVIGAAMATRALRGTPLPGPGVALHVIEPCRRQGVGRELLARVADVARSAGASALYAAQRVEVDGEEMRGWRWLGFEPCETVERHVIALGRLEIELAPLLARMRQRGRIPANAQLIPLYQADLRAVLQLHLDHLGGDRADLDRRLRGLGSSGFLPQQSQALLIDEKVRGCLLGHRKDADTIVVDADIVDHGLRGGWANVWLKLETARRARRLGFKQIEFTTFDHYGDTRSFTKKLGGVTTACSVLMYRPLSPDGRGDDRG